MLKIIKRYKDSFPNSIVEIVTNGFGEKVNKTLSMVPVWVSVANTSKSSPVQDFFTHNIAPVDLPEYQYADFNKACVITEECGLGLTNYGYYLCGAGAAVDRVFGFGVGIKSLFQVSKKALWNQRNTLCRHCGHFKYSGGTNSPATSRTQQTSTSWKEAYNRYKKKKPQMAMY